MAIIFSRVPLNWHFMVKNGPSVVCEPTILCTQHSLWQKEKKMQMEKAHKWGKIIHCRQKRAELKRKFNAPSNHLSFLCDAHTQRLAFGCEWKVHWVSIFECRESKFSKKPNGNNIIINLLSFVRVKCAYKNAHHPNRNGNFIQADHNIFKTRSNIFRLNVSEHVPAEAKCIIFTHSHKKRHPWWMMNKWVLI